MSKICFVSYEIHPTTWGGCGVLVHHLAEKLLQEGHEILLLLDIPLHEFDQFNNVDRNSFPNAHRIKAFRVDALCEDIDPGKDSVTNIFQKKSLRFAHALSKMAGEEHPDFVEFFEYCGIGYASFLRKLYGVDFQSCTLGTRVHTSVELMDQTEATKPLDAERFVMYGMEHAALDLAETILIPGRTFFESYYEHFYNIASQRTVLSPPPMQALPSVTLKSDAERYKITFLGRIFQLKGVEQLVKAAIMLLQRRMDRTLQFVFIGNDSSDSPVGKSYTAYLQQMIPLDLRDQFLFTGHLPHHQVAEHLSESLFSVFPNKFESFCYALHEVADAGVPIVANDLPAFRDSLRDGKDALFYDGSTRGLLSAMERMLDDPELRDELQKARLAPLPSTTQYYECPLPITSLANKADEIIEPLVIVLQETGATDQARKTLSALKAQTDARFSTLIFQPAKIGDSGAFTWLGRQWVARAVNAQMEVLSDDLDILSVETAKALVILRDGDVPDPRWMKHCALALSRNTQSAFSGTWLSKTGKLIPATLDVAPEAHPYWNGEELTRALLRTPPGQMLLDLFDANLGELGEIGYIWDAVEKCGAGTLLPEPWMQVEGDIETQSAKPVHLGYLLARHGRALRDRLSLLTATQASCAGTALQGTVEDLSAKFLHSQREFTRFITQLECEICTDGANANGSRQERVLKRVAELNYELRFIKSRLSYRLPRKFRKNPLYPLVRWSRANKRHVVTIRALGEKHSSAKDTEVWLLAARYGTGEPPIPWDYMAAPEEIWTRSRHADGASGEALVGRCGTLQFILHGENPVLEFLSHPWSGKVEIKHGGQCKVVDLFSDVARKVFIHPSSMTNGGSENHQVIHSVTSAPPTLSSFEEEWLATIRSNKVPVVALHAPRWLGVSASTEALFRHTLPFPFDMSEPGAATDSDIRRCVQLLLEGGVNHIVASGGDLAHYSICSRLKETKPSMRIDLLWHGTYVQFSEDYDWKVLKTWIEGARQGIVHTLGTVKKGQEEFFESIGCRGKFVMNYIDNIPQAASIPDAGGPHIGLWLSSENYRKLPYTMLSAVRMTPDAVLHGSNFSRRVMESLDFFGIKTGQITSQPISSEEMLDRISRTHLSLYVTFAECAPMLPLESLAAGVPCLVGPTSHLFEDDEYLRSRLVVPYPDRAEIIAQYIERALQEREQIIDAYAAYAPGYIRRAKQSVKAFLESD